MPSEVVTGQGVQDHPALAPVTPEELDAALRLYTRNQLADLANCDPSTIHRAITDPDSPLRYTHQRGRRKFIAWSVAHAWLDTFAIESAS